MNMCPNMSEIFFKSKSFSNQNRFQIKTDYKTLAGLSHGSGPPSGLPSKGSVDEIFTEMVDMMER